MKRTFAFITGVALLTVALAATGCKPRDVKKIALALAPNTTSLHCGISNFVEAVTYEDFCVNLFHGDNFGAANLFDDLEFGPYGGGEKVYTITVPYDMTIQIGVNAEGIVGLSVRTGCNATDLDQVVYSTTGYGGLMTYLYLEAGTYYVVIDSLHGEFSYLFGVCDGSFDGEY